MRRSAIAGACLAASLGFGAVAAASAAPSKSELVFSTATTTLGPGSETTWSSPGLTLTLYEMGEKPEGVTLAKGTIKVVTNPMGGSTAVMAPEPPPMPKHVEGSLTAFNLEPGVGTGFGPEPVEVLVTPKGLPWSYIFTSAGKVTITGTERLALEVEVAGSGVACVYEAPKISGTYAVGGPVEVNARQMFKAGGKNDKKSHACANQALLEGTISLTAGGEAVESQVLAAPK
jgi:hypothetical protein